MIEWVLVIGSGRMWAPGSELPAWWGYLCSGSLEEGMEEQIAKAEGWSSQGASHAHPDGGPDAACYPLLPGVSQPPFPGGVKPMGEG